MTTAVLATTLLQVGLSALAIGVAFALGAALQRRETYYWRNATIEARVELARQRVHMQSIGVRSPSLRQADVSAGGLRSRRGGRRA